MLIALVGVTGAAIWLDQGGMARATMQELSADQLRARLQTCANTGHLNGLEIEYWVGGGQPPPYYRSDQLRFLPTSDGETLELARPLWDTAFDPPQLTEKFERPAKPVEIQQVARLIVAARVFTERYPEEDKRGASDVLSTEVIITAEGSRLARVYHGSLPAPLRTLGAEIERLRAAVERDGIRTVWHQGRRLESAPPRRRAE